MEDRGLRDIERWRDKIEVRLDNRQVFFLFFGSALVACMLFVLGVIVGKRLESRGRAVSPEIEDPLALLDKVATMPRTSQTGVTFPQALFGTGAKTAAVDKHTRKALLPTPAASGAASAAEKPPQAPAGVESDATPAPAVGKTTRASTRGAESKSVAAKPEAKAEAQAAPAPESAASSANPAEAKQAKPLPVPTVAAGDYKGKAHFALQLSSFQDKAEAEAFAQKFESERPYMVASEIPGKGTWYRVRVGDYATSKDALAAKQAFEKKHSVIAYVAQK